MEHLLKEGNEKYSWFRDEKGNKVNPVFLCLRRYTIDFSKPWDKVETRVPENAEAFWTSKVCSRGEGNHKTYVHTVCYYSLNHQGR